METLSSSCADGEFASKDVQLVIEGASGAEQSAFMKARQAVRREK